MNRKTLFQRLNEDVLGRLYRNRIEHEYVIDKLVTVLQSKTMYSELTVDEVNNLYLFSDTDRWDVRPIDLLHGTNLFTKENGYI